MGGLTYIDRDLFLTDRKVIAHGVNCGGAFGAGVAKQIGIRFPGAKWEYLRKLRRDRWNLGDVQFVTLGEVVIANMATQRGYGWGGRHVDYDAVRSCLDQVFAYCEGVGQGVAMPKIGSGLGGGDWGEIESIIVGLLRTRDVRVDVHVYEPPAPR